MRNATTTHPASGRPLPLAPLRVGDRPAAVVQTPVTAGVRPPVRIRVERGYIPNRARAFADEPIRIAFLRLDQDYCTERVVFSSPHLEARLANGVTTTVELPPQPAGTIRFTCGMGRYRGEIRVVERRTGDRSTLGRGAAIAGSVLAVAGVVAGLLEPALGVSAAVLAGGVALAPAVLWRRLAGRP